MGLWLVSAVNDFQNEATKTALLEFTSKLEDVAQRRRERSGERKGEDSTGKDETGNSTTAEHHIILCRVSYSHSFCLRSQALVDAFNLGVTENFNYNKRLKEMYVDFQSLTDIGQFSGAGDSIFYCKPIAFGFFCKRFGGANYVTGLGLSHASVSNRDITVRKFTQKS